MEVGGSVVEVVVEVGGSVVVVVDVRKAPEAGPEFVGLSRAQAEGAYTRNNTDARRPSIDGRIRMPWERQHKDGTAGDGTDDRSPGGPTPRGARLRWRSMPSLSPVNGYPHR